MEYILLLVGFIRLIKGADFFVEGSSSLAGILKVPSVIIGLTMRKDGGTSAREGQNERGPKAPPPARGPKSAIPIAPLELFCSWAQLGLVKQKPLKPWLTSCLIAKKTLFALI